MTPLSDDELFEALGLELKTAFDAAYTPREERLLAGFEEIAHFFTTHKYAPQHGASDIFERLYALRLDRLRALPEARELLAGRDVHGLLNETPVPLCNDKFDDALDEDALLAELGVSIEAKDDITQLNHVRAKRRLADEVAERIPCKDFARFKPLFEAVQSELKNGLRQSRPFERDASAITGNFFILGGQLTYVAEMGEDIKAPNGDNDARLRVIYSNGTESNLLRRSLKRALHKDDAGRRVSEPDPGPLFSGDWDVSDIESGTIYVLQSLSDHPYIAAHRELIHKIGVTGGSVETRIAGAVHEATYLLAEVKVVASYRLSQINRTKLEKLFHRLFASAQLALSIMDRFGNPVQPKEWFLVPLTVIDDAVERIRDGSIPDWVYDQHTARLVKKETLADATDSST